MDNNNYGLDDMVTCDNASKMNLEAAIQSLQSGCLRGEEDKTNDEERELLREED